MTHLPLSDSSVYCLNSGDYCRCIVGLKVAYCIWRRLVSFNTCWADWWWVRALYMSWWHRTCVRELSGYLTPASPSSVRHSVRPPSTNIFIVFVVNSRLTNSFSLFWYRQHCGWKRQLKTESEWEMERGMSERDAVGGRHEQALALSLAVLSVCGRCRWRRRVVT